jgi:hypothetical protein
MPKTESAPPWSRVDTWWEISAYRIACMHSLSPLYMCVFLVCPPIFGVDRSNFDIRVYDVIFFLNIIFDLQTHSDYFNPQTPDQEWSFPFSRSPIMFSSVYSNWEANSHSIPTNVFAWIWCWRSVWTDQTRIYKRMYWSDRCRTWIPILRHCQIQNLRECYWHEIAYLEPRACIRWHFKVPDLDWHSCYLLIVRARIAAYISIFWTVLEWKYG